MTTINKYVDLSYATLTPAGSWFLDPATSTDTSDVGVAFEYDYVDILYCNMSPANTVYLGVLSSGNGNTSFPFNYPPQINRGDMFVPYNLGPGIRGGWLV